jgi:hypothetical protein
MDLKENLCMYRGFAKYSSRRSYPGTWVEYLIIINKGVSMFEPS